MKYGIALLGNRISPRCTYADSILFVSQRGSAIGTKKRISVNELHLNELYEVLVQNRVDILVCGGITGDSKEYLRTRNLAIIDNVIGSADKIIQALKSGKLRQDYGFTEIDPEANKISLNNQEHTDELGQFDTTQNSNKKKDEPIDCLKCNNRVCLDGKACEKSINDSSHQLAPTKELIHMLDAATDIVCEKERTLCRLSELIYFCLEMQYRRLGVAYCIDLEEPTDILVRLLRRFFTVYPVCCQVGGFTQTNPQQSELQKDKKYSNKDTCCNPWGQAQILNRLRTDLNVMVGLCMGADCVFIQGSLAPTTGLFIKDKSLANNPIGAIYSEYYLREAVQAHP
ncbi:MAG: DUF1847 domain-containing protein [Candidatus Zixiibacteriota bacterium]